MRTPEKPDSAARRLRRRPSSIWPTHRMGHYPQQYVREGEVLIQGQRTLELSFFGTRGVDGLGVSVKRSDARLLAKRILQCLEDTK